MTDAKPLTEQEIAGIKDGCTQSRFPDDEPFQTVAETRRLIATIEAQQAEIERLRRYVVHHPDCQGNWQPPTVCTCGLTNGIAGKRLT